MRELVLICPEERAEELSDALLDAGMLSVSVEDADSDTDAERALFGEPGLEPEVHAWHSNRIVALIPDGLDPEQVIAALHGAGLINYDENEWFLRDVPDTDWVRLTQSQFPPIQVGKRIWIVPSWHRDSLEVPPASGQQGGGESIHIELDPGLAFGTGSHPTTHLCLEWLEYHLKGQETVLDYGCGSGILAIAAKKLGAGDMMAVDIDEQAVQTARHNALVNAVRLQAMLPDALPEQVFQVVVANILSNPLKVLAPMLANRVMPGGLLALSGVLEWQADEVAQAYAPWLTLSVWKEREGWVCLHGQRAY